MTSEDFMMGFCLYKTYLSFFPACINFGKQRILKNRSYLLLNDYLSPIPLHPRSPKREGISL